MGISPGDRGDRVRGNAAGRDRHPGRLAAFLGADHYSVFSNGPAVEREDRRGQHGAVRTAGRPDGAGAGPQPRTTGAVVTTADPVTAGAAAGSRGIALLYAFGRLGLIGRYLEAAGISIAFSTAAVVLAQTFVSLPYLVISLEGAARTAGADYEVVAATLGARPGTVWWRVTLPLLLPGVVSGSVLAFARSLGEFGAILTFAGSRQGVTRTLPLEIYLQRVTDPDAAVALSLLLVVVAALVVLGVGARTPIGTDTR